MKGGVSSGPMFRRVLVAQIGARRHYAVPRGFQRAGRLACLVTDATADLWPWRALKRIPRGLQPAGLRRLRDRRAEGIPRDRVCGLPGFAISGLLDRPGRPGEAPAARWARRNARFAEAVAAGGLGDADAVYAFNAAALEILYAARARNLATILDQTSMPWRDHTRMLREERARHPGWEESPNELDEDGVLAAREEEEWRLADAVVCGSVHVREALAARGVPAGRVAVVPYGLDTARFAAERGEARGADAPLRVLFAGKVQLAKGVAYLYEAARALGAERVQMRLVGPTALAPAALDRLRAAGMEVRGSVPRSEMASQYAWADAFAFPSLSEGSANVCYEAMAAGLPLVVTPEAGSPVRDGEDGWIVPARDAEALAAALGALAGDRRRCRAMGRSAAYRAASFSAASYGDRLAGALDDILRRTAAGGRERTP